MNKLTQTQRTGVIVVLIITALLLCGYIIDKLNSGLCGNDLLDSITSPSGKNKVLIFVRNCGATIDWMVDVSIVDSRDVFDDEHVGNIFRADADHGAVRQQNKIGGPLVRAKWLDENNLEVGYSQGSRMFKQEKTFKDILITYTSF